MLFNPASEFADFGHPFILYEPKASFIGRLILTTLVSPFLQFFSTVSGANVTSVFRQMGNSVDTQPPIPNHPAGAVDTGCRQVDRVRAW